MKKNCDLVVKSNQLVQAVSNLSLVEIRLIQLAIVDAREVCNGLIEQDTLIGSIYTASRGVYESNEVNEKADVQFRI